MIVSLVYRTVRGLLSLPKLLLRREAPMEAEALVSVRNTHLHTDLRKRAA